MTILVCPLGLEGEKCGYSGLIKDLEWTLCTILISVATATSSAVQNEAENEILSKSYMTGQCNIDTIHLHTDFSENRQLVYRVHCCWQVQTVKERLDFHIFSTMLLSLMLCEIHLGNKIEKLLIIHNITLTDSKKVRKLDMVTQLTLSHLYTNMVFWILPFM